MHLPAKLTARALGLFCAFFTIGLLTTASARAVVIPTDTFTLSPQGGVSSNSSIIVFNAGDQPPDGTATADIATTAGTSYILSYEYETSGGIAQSITASATDYSTSSLLGSEFSTSTVIGALQSFQFEFTAIGAQTAIEFEDYANNYTYSEDGVVSNVNLTSEAPEPASLSLMGVGLFALGWLRRRKAA
jgi:hypothetical protein